MICRVAVWEIVVFVLNALLFALVGLQLSRILDTLTGRSTGELMRYAVLVTGTVILTRIIWVPVFSELPRWLWSSTRHPAKLDGSGLYLPCSF